MLDEKKLKELATTVRYLIIKATTAAGSGHVSSSLSATDLITTLMFGGNFFHTHLDNPNHPNNDRLIFSKGHAAPLLYAIYTMAHQVDETELLRLRTFDSPLEGHPTMRFPFTEAATGSLGQGLSVGLGMALSAKYLDNLSYKTFVLLGDSEMAEGSVWESIQLASYYETNNLIGILDLNGLGQRGPTMYGHDVKVYEERLNSFGWKTITINGHDLVAIKEALYLARKEKKCPVMIIARTVKGKGISFMENKEGWHGKALTKEEAEKAIKELPNLNISARGVVFKPEKEPPTQHIYTVAQKNIAYRLGEMVAPREAYGEALVSIYPHHQNMVVLDAEVSNSTYAATFNKAHPHRFFEMFIAEQNMVGAALGFSRRGKIPFVSTFAAFFTRAADQIRMAGYSNSNIKFVGSHVGVSIGEDGASQMGLEDIALFRAQMGSVVLCPADGNATVKLVEKAAEHTGNVYLRAARGKTPVIYRPEECFSIGGSKILRKSDQDDVTIVAVGVTVYEALKANEILLSDGISARVIDLYSIKPLDVNALREAADQTGAILTVEDHYEAGGIGDAVSAVIGDSGVKMYRLAVKKLPRSGKPEQLLAYEEIDAAAIVKKVREMVRQKTKAFTK